MIYIYIYIYMRKEPVNLLASIAEDLHSSGKLRSHSPTSGENRSDTSSRVKQSGLNCFKSQRGTVCTASLCNQFELTFLQTQATQQEKLVLVRNNHISHNEEVETAVRQWSQMNWTHSYCEEASKSFRCEDSREPWEQFSKGRHWVGGGVEGFIRK